jgi:hypothetical protein
MDREQASTRRLVALAWLPHPFKSSGAELATRGRRLASLLLQ